MLILFAVLVAVLLILVVVLCRVLFSDSEPYFRADVEVQSGVEVESSRLATKSGHIERQNKRDQTFLVQDDRRHWQLELQGADGTLRGKSFSGRVILGRAQETPEPSGMLYLSANATISKQQCEVLDIGSGLAVRNCSRSNITRVDGCPATEPVLIHKGSVLRIGDTEWRVTTVRQC